MSFLENENGVVKATMITPLENLSLNNLNMKTSELEASMGVRLLTAGTAACIADVATFPFDTAKVRLQIQGEGVVKIPVAATATITPNGMVQATANVTLQANGTVQYRGMIGTIVTIAKQEGPKALYNGLSAGLQRQMCFASIRLGLYDSTKEMYQRLFNENPEGMHIGTRILAGLTTGALAVSIAQPTDVVKVRFQAQNKLTNPAVRYTTTMQAYRTIGRQEGVRGLWKGVIPNVVRNSIVNVSEIVCYDIVKDCLITYARMHDNILCHFTGACIAGFVTTVVASPIDVVKTRYMNSPPGQYRGAIDCGIQMGRREGFPAFYKGFVPSFARITLWNIALWITYEQFKQMFYSKPKLQEIQ